MEIALAASAVGSGVSVRGKSKAGEFSGEASERAWSETLATGERVFVFLLRWIGSHPILSVIFASMGAFLIKEYFRYSAQVKGLKFDYKATRERTRVAVSRNRRDRKV